LCAVEKSKKNKEIKERRKTKPLKATAIHLERASLAKRIIKLPIKGSIILIEIKGKPSMLHLILYRIMPSIKITPINKKLT